MLAILNRYKVFMIILTILMLALLIWLFFAAQDRDKVPSRGVFVTHQIHSFEGRNT